MARKEYQQKLDDLREDVLYMGEVVRERLARSRRSRSETRNSGGR